MKDAWDTNVYGTPLFTVIRKLSIMKQNLIEWKKSQCPLPSKTSEAALHLEKLQKCLADDSRHMDIQEQEKVARFELD